MERWRTVLRLAILAKEGISIDILREVTPNKVSLPPELNYEEDFHNSTVQSKRDRRVQNKQLKNAGLNKCQKIEAAGILGGGRPWKFCDSKAVPLTYLSLGTQGQRFFGSREPTVLIDQVSTKSLRDILDSDFTEQKI